MKVKLKALNILLIEGKQHWIYHNEKLYGIRNQCVGRLPILSGIYMFCMQCRAICFELLVHAGVSQHRAKQHIDQYQETTCSTEQEMKVITVDGNIVIKA